MILGIFDRLILLNVLPKMGDYTTLKLIRVLREELSFSEEEHKALQFQQDGLSVKWSKEAEQWKDVPIGEKATDIIVEALKRLNKDKKLTEQHMGIYERFVVTDSESYGI